MKNTSLNLPNGIHRGINFIKNKIKSFPQKPGVYKMSNNLGEMLYIGKAKNLKKRVISYTKVENLSIRHLRMVSEIFTLDYTLTDTEVEALLLESNLIKTFKPKYNILLKDDKSFPNILITKIHDFPQLKKHRGRKDFSVGDYYGPFASASSVNKTIDAMQRAFLIRNCSDNYFKSRTRPCLQYQIKRCTAPCVGLISEKDYNIQVQQTKKFFAGKSIQIQKSFAKKMEFSAKTLDFETAALWRNRIRAITSIQSNLNNNINVQGINNADIIVIYKKSNKTSINITFMRSGSNFGNHTFFPRHNEEETEENILSAFIGQFYSNKNAPEEIILSHKIKNVELISDALKKISKSKVKITCPQKGTKKNLIKSSINNLIDITNRKIIEDQNIKLNFLELSKTLEIVETIKRIEVYDNSHIQGNFAIGAMIVSNEDGFQKNEYRKFNFEVQKNFIGGDDFFMMKEMISRRFKRMLKDKNDVSFQKKPSLILIDGGRGHLNAVKDVLNELKIEDICVCAISKGKNRNKGEEKIHLLNKKSFYLPMNSKILYFLQNLRDEAHRFAIVNHREKRKKKITFNPLDEIEGIGRIKKQGLLKFFGSAKEVSKASINGLQNVEGISATIAKRIYNYFHS